MNSRLARTMSARRGQGEIIGGLIVVTVLLAILAPMLLGLILGYSNTVSKAQSASLVNDLAANERVAVRGIPEGSQLAASGWFPGVEIVNTGTIAVDLVTMYLIDATTGEIFAAVDLTKARGGTGIIEAMYYSGGELPPAGEPIRLNPGETLRVKFNTTIVSVEVARNLFVKVESARGVLHPKGGSVEETVVPEVPAGLAAGTGSGSGSAEVANEFDNYLDFVRGGSIEVWRPKALIGYKLDPLAEWTEVSMDPVWVAVDAPWAYYARVSQSSSLLPLVELAGYSDVLGIDGSIADDATTVYVIMPSSGDAGILAFTGEASIGASSSIEGFLGMVVEVVEDGKDYLYIVGYAADVKNGAGESMLAEPFRGYFTGLFNIQDYIEEWWSYTGARGELVLSTVGTEDYDYSSTFPGSGFSTLDGDALVFQWTPYLTIKGYDYVEVSLNVYVDVVVGGPEALLDAAECSDFLANAENIAYTPLITVALQAYDEATGSWVTVDVFPIDTGFDIVEALSGRGLVEGPYRVSGSVEFDIDRNSVYRVSLLFADPLLTFNPDGDSSGCTPEVTFIVDSVKISYGRTGTPFSVPSEATIYIVAPDDDFLAGFLDEDIQEEIVDYIAAYLENLGLSYTILEDEEDICSAFDDDVENSIVFYVADVPPWMLCGGMGHHGGHHGPGGWLADWLSHGNVLAMMAAPYLNQGYFRNMVLAAINSDVAQVFSGFSGGLTTLEASPEWIDVASAYDLSIYDAVTLFGFIRFAYNTAVSSDDWRSFTIFSYMAEDRRQIGTPGSNGSVYLVEIEASGVAILSSDLDGAIVLVTPNYYYYSITPMPGDDDDEEALARVIAEQLLGLALAASDKISG